MGCSSTELSILITGDKEIAALNAKYRSKPKPTDVLSFPLQKKARKPHCSGALGDIVLSLETAVRQAKEYRVSFREEFLRLLIHGALHLQGYDHEGVSKAAAAKMRRAETRLLKLLLPS